MCEGEGDGRIQAGTQDCELRITDFKFKIPD
jgi:hypothetical protein